MEKLVPPRLRVYENFKVFVVNKKVSIPSEIYKELMENEGFLPLPLRWIFFFSNENIAFTDKLRAFVLATGIFASVKFDGSNIGKDEEDVIYSRRLILPAGEKQFLKTDLKRVKEANIERFKNMLLESVGLSW